MFNSEQSAIDCSFSSIEGAVEFLGGDIFIPPVFEVKILEDLSLANTSSVYKYDCGLGEAFTKVCDISPKFFYEIERENLILKSCTLKIPLESKVKEYEKMIFNLEEKKHDGRNTCLIT